MASEETFVKACAMSTRRSCFSCRKRRMIQGREGVVMKHTHMRTNTLNKLSRNTFGSMLQYITFVFFCPSNLSYTSTVILRRGRGWKANIN